MGDTLVPSVAAPLLRRLDQTRHYLTYALDTDRPCQKQIRTRGRKRLVASAIDHPAAPGEAACLYQDGSDAPGPAVKNGTNLESSPRHCPARDATAVAPPGREDRPGPPSCTTMPKTSGLATFSQSLIFSSVRFSPSSLSNSTLGE